MKKTIKIFSIILMVSIFVLFLSNTVLASGTTGASSIMEDLKPNYEDTGSYGKLTGLGSNIISIISVVAMVVAVIVLLILGIKYMIGSASEKAEFKKSMIPYLVGAVIIFGAGAIAQVVVQIASGITNSPN